MITVADIAGWMNRQAPLELSESWDNTGLLLGDAARQVSKVLTCLTLTPASVSEAIDLNVNLVIAHHPLPFRPVSRITTDSSVGRLLWSLANAGISVYCPHTAWDSAETGINATIARRLGLQSIAALVPSKIAGLEQLGAGRIGQLSTPVTLAKLCQLVREQLPNCRLRGVDARKLVSRIAIACGSGGALLDAAINQRCDLFLTGEATFHTCLQAEAAEISLMLVGHFASEQFAMAELAKMLTTSFPSVQCCASQKEKDPVTEFPVLLK